MAAFSLAQVLFSPFNSMIKNSIGTKNTILTGFFLVTITTIGLGAIANLSNGLYFTYCGIGLRFFQGAGDIML
jgi:MFS family permease